MTASLEDTLISVCRQALVEDAPTVKLGSRSYPVRRTSRSKLREADFQFQGQTLRGGTEPENEFSLGKTRQTVIQFLDDGPFTSRTSWTERYCPMDAAVSGK
jgi:hypothetical protein